MPTARKQSKRKANVAKVMKLLDDLGIEDFKEAKTEAEKAKKAQWVMNNLVDFLLLFIRREVKDARSTYAIVLWFIKELDYAWYRLNVTDRRYDELRRHAIPIDNRRADEQAMQSIGQILKKMKIPKPKRS